MRFSLWTVLASVSLALIVVASGCGQPPTRSNVVSALTTSPRETTLKFAVPKNGRARPLVVVLADNDGTETTDFVIPYGVLKGSGAADVMTVSTGPGTVTLIPALRIRADMTLAQFDAATPVGADIVIVPAMKRNDDPVVLNWVRAQFEKGAMVVSICEGARVIANAGLLEGKSATTHWFALEPMAKKFPGTTWVRDSRWVVDGNVMTTTGVSASIPASLALIESIAGRRVAESAAERLGLDTWAIEHDTSAFGWTFRHVAVGATNWLAWWRHETVEIPVEEGFNEISTALSADSWSRTFRSQALATNAARLVRSRHGLLVETEVASNGDSFVLPKPTDNLTITLVDTLEGVADRYGEGTADLVALGLEHRRRGSRR